MYLQLEKGKLEERNATLNTANNVLASQQLKRHHKRSPSQVPSSSISSQSESRPSSTVTVSCASESDDELIQALGKKYALTTEMFAPSKSIFQSPCPDPPADISGPRCYAKKSDEMAALATELYASIDHKLHPYMRKNDFVNTVCNFRI